MQVSALDGVTVLCSWAQFVLLHPGSLLKGWIMLSTRKNHFQVENGNKQTIIQWIMSSNLWTTVPSCVIIMYNEGDTRAYYKLKKKIHKKKSPETARLLQILSKTEYQNKSPYWQNLGRVQNIFFLLFNFHVSYLVLLPIAFCLFPRYRARLKKKNLGASWILRF